MPFTAQCAALHHPCAARMHQCLCAAAAHRNHHAAPPPWHRPLRPAAGQQPLPAPPPTPAKTRPGRHRPRPPYLPPPPQRQPAAALHRRATLRCPLHQNLGNIRRPRHPQIVDPPQNVAFNNPRPVGRSALHHMQRHHVVPDNRLPARRGPRRSLPVHPRHTVFRQMESPLLLKVNPRRNHRGNRQDDDQRSRKLPPQLLHDVPILSIPRSVFLCNSSATPGHAGILKNTKFSPASARRSTAFGIHIRETEFYGCAIVEKC